MQNAPETSTWARAGDVAYGDRLHRKLIAELSKAGCFRPTPARNAFYGTFILVGYGAAYVALLAGPGLAARALALAALAFLTVHAGFFAHEVGHGAITRDRRATAWLGPCCRCTSPCGSCLRR